MQLYQANRAPPLSDVTASMAALRSRTFMLVESLSPSTIRSSAVDDDSASAPLSEPFALTPPYTSGHDGNFSYVGAVLVALFLSFFFMAASAVVMRRYSGAANGDAVGPAEQAPPVLTVTQGVDRNLVDVLPIVVFRSSKDVNVRSVEESVNQDAKYSVVSVLPPNDWRHRAECVVCLTDFHEAESIRMLPKCEHCFHEQCIEMWLSTHSTCPLCRRSLLPSDMVSCPCSIDQASSS
ncbi:hypothetical protein KP509_29G080000 [Ceratopteris richardii]|uniref:RING-type E3 ubiquitin transferase n=1 Tax=Ceratopteris richardii TaxID=49495 RepID=A0A8T2R9E6_CERRI|nr:hypothetical protein KP509_29G080000 [Ceratopteris richardii]